MKVILFGATGMVGQGVLRECLLDARITRVLTVGRTITGQQDAKLEEIAHADLFNLSGRDRELTGYDACFFCLGVSSAGMDEAKYTHITEELTLSVARTVLRLNPSMRFLYVSGMGTDSTERGRTMWARVKGRTENALLRMGFSGAYMLRPAGIVPMHGIRSKTAVYQIFYTVLGPIFPLLARAFPKYVTTTDELSRMMVALAVDGGPSRILENREITGR